MRRVLPSALPRSGLLHGIPMISNAFSPITRTTLKCRPRSSPHWLENVPESFGAKWQSAHIGPRPFDPYQTSDPYNAGTSRGGRGARRTASAPGDLYGRHVRENRRLGVLCARSPRNLPSRPACRITAASVLGIDRQRLAVLTGSHTSSALFHFCPL